MRPPRSSMFRSRAPLSGPAAPLAIALLTAALGAQRAVEDPGQLVRDALAEDWSERADTPLARADAEALAARAFARWRDAVADAYLDAAPPLPPNLPAIPGAERAQATRAAWSIRVGELEMPFRLLRREPADAPVDGPRALYLCMHGGGQRRTVDGPHAWDVNSREWDAQTMLAARVYPGEGLFLVPRMADDRLGRWWHRHNQAAFDRLIEVAIARYGVDPDRVYLLGISEGGYGTDILAPFMPDRFAGADAMAAGVNPGDNPPENLRHLPFRTDIGADDTTYDRVGLARKFHAVLDGLHDAHPDDYVHQLAEQAGRGHGIDYRPGVAWLGTHRRDPWPATITWQSRRLHGERRPAFYWLGLEAGAHQGAVRIVARLDRDANSVELTAEDLSGDGPTPLTGATLRVLLRDELLDLDRPVTVRVNGAERFAGEVPRTARNIVDTLALRGDPQLVFPGLVEVALPDG